MQCSASATRQRGSIGIAAVQNEGGGFMSIKQRTTRGGNVFTGGNRIVNTGDAYDIFNQVNTTEYTPIIERRPLPVFSALRDRITGPGTVSVVAGETRLDATAGTSGLYTRELGHYLPGLVGVAGIRARFEETAGVTYRYGYGDDNGNRIGLEWRDGAWYTFIDSGSVRWYEQPRSQWVDPLDGTGPTGLNADLNGVTFRTQFGWYGGLSIKFKVAIADRINGDRLVDIDSSGARPDAVTIEQPDLPLFCEATTGGVIYRGGAQYGVFGRYRPQYRVTSSPVGENTAVGTALVPLVSFRIKSAEQWRGVRVILTGETVVGDADGRYEIIIDGDLTGAAWGGIAGIDPNETAAEVDTSATAVTGGYRTASGIIAAGAGRASGAADVDPADLPLPVGATVTVAVATFAATNATFRAVLRIREQF